MNTYKISLAWVFALFFLVSVSACLNQNLAVPTERDAKEALRVMMKTTEYNGQKTVALFRLEYFEKINGYDGGVVFPKAYTVEFQATWVALISQPDLFYNVNNPQETLEKGKKYRFRGKIEFQRTEKGWIARIVSCDIGGVYPSLFCHFHTQLALRGWGGGF